MHTVHFRTELLHYTNSTDSGRPAPQKQQRNNNDTIASNVLLQLSTELMHGDFILDFRSLAQ